MHWSSELVLPSGARDVVRGQVRRAAYGLMPSQWSGAFGAATRSMVSGTVLQWWRTRESKPGGPGILSVEETKDCADAAYDLDEGKPTKRGTHRVAKGGVYPDNEGFRAVLLEPVAKDDRRRILAFAGTDPFSRGDVVTDVVQALALEPSQIPLQYRVARDLAGKVVQRFGRDLVVCGHSLGGGLANYVSLLHGLHGTAINAAPLGFGTLRDARQHGRGFRPGLFVHYNHLFDLISRTPGINAGIVCVLESSLQSEEVALLMLTVLISPAAFASVAVALGIKYHLIDQIDVAAAMTCR